MFWSEWGQSGNIKKSFMDGTNQKTIILNTGQAIGLTLDHELKRLFWAENKNGTSIISTDLNGLNRKILLSGKKGVPLALTIHKEYVFWSNDASGTFDWFLINIDFNFHHYAIELWKTNKITGDDLTLVTRFSEPVTSISPWYKSKQQDTNQCGVSNGGCSHLCLTLPAQLHGETYTCSCPTHYLLQNNTCVGNI